MKKLLVGLLVTLIYPLISAPALAGDIVVIVNKANSQNADKAFITRIYLGKVGEWPDGTSIEALDQAEDNPIHDQFYSELLGKSPALVKTLWAQNIFSGKRLPPKTANPDVLVKQIVSTHKNAIGYIKASSVDDSVKVILK